MQKILQKLGLAVPSMVLAFTTLAVVPVMAEHGSNGTTSGSTGTSQSGTDTTVATTTSTESETDTPDSTATTELRHKGADLVTEMQNEHKNTKSDAEKTKVCEAHTKGLETKFASISKNAQAFQDRIDAIFQKAQDYNTGNKLNIANWDTLVKAATDAQTASAQSITDLKALTPSTLDCNANGAVAQEVATFKVAAQKTRDNLKTYKMAVKDVLHALLAVKDASTSTDTKTTEGSN